jgi:hypothetical protein
MFAFLPSFSSVSGTSTCLLHKIWNQYHLNKQ